jgi:Flp pilus assembly protein TadG
MLIHKKVKCEKGIIIVEFAIALPLLLLLAFGFIESGVLLYNKQVVTNASREVARAAINPIPLLDPIDVVAAAEPYNDLLIRFGTSALLSVTSPAANRTYPQDITITVTWDHYFLVPAIVRWNPTLTLTSTTAVRMM